jgi:exonuclease III
MRDFRSSEPMRYALAATDSSRSFLERATRVERLFKAILPDDRANEFAPIRKVIRVVMDRIGEAGGRPEVSGVMAQIEQHRAREQRRQIRAVTATISGTMRLLSWNVRGYSGPIREKQLAEVLKLAPDVIALQEIVRGSLEFWRGNLGEKGYDVLASDPKLLEIEGPILPHKGHRMGRRKNLNLIAVGGVIEPLPSIEVGAGEGFPEKYLAGRARIDGASFDVHNVHTPPGSTMKMLKVEYWEAVMRRVNETTEAPRILCGDFNSPWSEDDEGFVTGGGRSDPDEERKWREAELSFLEHPDLRDVYRAHHVAGERYPVSHMRGDTRCRYDHIYASSEFDLDNCRCEYLEQILEAGLSDHAPVLAMLSLR